ncbi:hydrogenase formation protein HypD [Mariprofundus sp. EBB-1]|uniref:hydrogenase formation protein HypD n=1 Tax=Mariprofundus sp. EBB-1 TaxID=2650971 RepID=UPI000EF1A8C1|nr:hydrogenase formation protein HypD [Mariprofundus sp. EBB-1]RLL54331.1 hydrogenase formation protein HypD [Mariprofundus sp. EBB-1]
MKYVNEFRNGDVAAKLARVIANEVESDRDYRLMEFCGGHTHAIFRFGIQDLMPENVNFVHGPGCPVCVLPKGRIDNAIKLVQDHNVILCTYADLVRVPATKQMSLLKAKADGGDIRMVYSTQDALQIARQNPNRQVVFFAIGFETTTPPTAVALQVAQQEGLNNFSVFCNHVLTPPAMRHILQQDGDQSANIDGILGPSHVSTIIGSQAYAFCATEFHTPIVIAGFEPLDVMQSTLMLIRQLNSGRVTVENEYTRVVTDEGNRKAQALMQEVFELRPIFEWRGLGMMPNSALQIRDIYAEWDAEQRFAIEHITSSDVKSCLCPAILRGLNKPTDCKLFGTVCTPENPMGACMVSSEGSCAAYWSYGRFRQPDTATAQQERTA